MRNIYILPTENPSRIFENVDCDLSLNDELEPNGIMCQNQNVYITSDEKPKEGELIIYRNGDEYYFAEYRLGYYDRYVLCKKIILTTDTELIKDGVQPIPDEFLEWFVNNPSCEWVDVIIEYKDGYGNWFKYDKEFWDKQGNKPKFRTRYKIILPKEEPCTCTDECLSYLTKTCKRIEEEPKQETLEEAAESHVENPDIIAKFSENKAMYKRMFQDGAKWQQKRSYSDENMRKAFCAGFASNVTSSINDAFEKWFEQFK